jgi:hypothetical protein
MVQLHCSTRELKLPLSTRALHILPHNGLQVECSLASRNRSTRHLVAVTASAEATRSTRSAGSAGSTAISPIRAVATVAPVGTITPVSAKGTARTTVGSIAVTETTGSTGSTGSAGSTTETTGSAWAARAAAEATGSAGAAKGFDLDLVAGLKMLDGFLHQISARGGRKEAYINLDGGAEHTGDEKESGEEEAGHHFD